MPIRMDVSNVESNFTPIAPGDYEAYVFNVESTTSKKGKPMLKVTYKLADGGRQLFDNITLESSMAWKLKMLYAACGITDERLSDPENEVEEAELQGQKVVLSVIAKPASTDPDTGTEYPAGNNIKRVVSADDYTPQTAPAGGW